MKKKITFSIAAIALAGMISGCGGGSSSSGSSNNANTNNAASTKSVKVVDGYVIGANVCDENGVCASTEKDGIAKAAYTDTTLIATGGYIDINANNEIDDNDIKLPDTFTLKTPAGKSVISPLTALIANGADANKLAEV